MDATTYAKEGTHWKEHFDGRFIKATDGPFFLHILRQQSRIAHELAKKSPHADVRDDPQLVLLTPMRKAIQARYDEATDNPEHFQKVDWFVRYWNNHLACSIKGLEAITPRSL